MLLFIFSRNNVIPVYVNSLFSLYVTVPLYCYCLFDVHKKYYKNIPILIIVEAIVDNILLAYNIIGALYISKIVFYTLLTMPIFIHNKTQYEKGSPEWNMQRATKIIIVIFVPLTILFIPFSSVVFEVSYASTLFWAVFTVMYQIPGLVYCKKKLLKKDLLAGKTGLASLTKRENEVASAICSGLKYEEIAQSLFISLSAVKKHSYTIYRKLGINNNRELMQVFMAPPQDDTENP
jgi:DNA-binding CsgD family transcriptional regulator